MSNSTYNFRRIYGSAADVPTIVQRKHSTEYVHSMYFLQLRMGTFIVRWFAHYLRVSGIFCHDSTNKGHFGNFICDIIQIIFALSASLLIPVMLADYCSFYLRDVLTLDFFVIVSLINRVTYMAVKLCSCSSSFSFSDARFGSSFAKYIKLSEKSFQPRKPVNGS